MREWLEQLAEARESHRERHRSTGLGFVFADRLEYLSADHWDRVASGATLFLSRAYLGALERAGMDNLVPRYAIVFRGAQPVAIVAAQLLHLKADRLMRVTDYQEPGEDKGASPTPKRRSRRKDLLKGVGVRLLVCGDLLSWGCHGVAFAAGEDPAALWPAVAEALYRIRRAERLNGQVNLVLVKDLSPEHDTAHQSLRRFSYRSLETDPNMMLEVLERWRSYEDYAGDLAGTYRKAARKIHKAIDDAGARVEVIRDLEPHAERLHDLYLQVHQNADVRPVTLPARFLPDLSRALGDRFVCLAIRRDAELLGFATLLIDGADGVGYYMGFDRAAARELPLYLRLLHALVESAISARVRRLSLGRTALDPKARLGGRPQPMQIWLRHRIPAVNLFVRNLVGMVPHQDAPERNPFK